MMNDTLTESEILVEEKRLAEEYGARYIPDDGRGAPWGKFQFPHGYVVWMCSASRWMVAAVINHHYCRHRAFESLPKALSSARTAVNRISNTMARKRQQVSI